MKRVFRGGRVVVRSAEQLDAIHIGARLREADCLEVEALGAGLPLAAVTDSFKMSRRAYTVTHDGEPVLIFGVADHPDDPTVGIPWMLATPAIERLGFTFARHGKSVAEEAFAGYRYLTNIMVVQNTVAHRWLRYLGFEFTDLKEDLGHNGETLVQFAKEQSPCAAPPSLSP